MNKQELHEAFSTIHASEDLVKEVLTMKNKERKPVPIGRILWKAAAVAAVLALIVGVLGLWPAKVDPETGEIIAVPGVMKVYACEAENTLLEAYELTDSIDSGHGFWTTAPVGLTMGFGIPLTFHIDPAFFDDAEISFYLTVELGRFLHEDTGEKGKEVCVKTGETVWWAGDNTWHEEVKKLDSSRKFYAYILIYAGDILVGYGIIDFVYYPGTEEGIAASFGAVNLTTYCFPMNDGSYQDVSEEYVWMLIEKHKQS